MVAFVKLNIAVKTQLVLYNNGSKYLNATSFSLGYVLLYFFTLGTNEKQLTAVDDSFKQIKT